MLHSFYHHVAQVQCHHIDTVRYFQEINFDLCDYNANIKTVTTLLTDA